MNLTLITTVLYSNICSMACLHDQVSVQVGQITYCILLALKAQCNKIITHKPPSHIMSKGGKPNSPWSEKPTF